MRELCPDGSWFALTVKHQHERRVETALARAGVRAFLPMYRTRRQWADRLQELDVPYFPGYVFGRFSIKDKIQVLDTPGVSRIVGFGGVPAPLPDNEIEAIRAAVDSSLPARPWPYLQPGNRVRVAAGPLRGIEGVLLREKGGVRLLLGVELLQRWLAVEIDPETVVPI